LADDDNDSPSSIGGGLPGFILPVITAVAALVAGAIVGAIAVWVLKPAQIVTNQVQVPRDLTQDELKLACGPLLDEMAANLDAANDKVTDLVGQVHEKETKVQELEDEMKRRGARGAEMKHELDAAKAELETVKAQLKQAIDEKEAVIVELKKTLVELDTSKAETKVAKTESLGHEWDAFLNQSQLDICEKGNRKKLGSCREDVTAVVATYRTKYEHCIKSGQEAPTLHEAAKDFTMPQFGEYLNQDDKFVKDWYVMLCDPTLPEASGFAETPSTPSGGIEDLDGEANP
jgi:hypothetical protein